MRTRRQPSFFIQFYQKEGDHVEGLEEKADPMRDTGKGSTEDYRLLFQKHKKRCCIFAASFSIRSDRNSIYRDAGVRMCYNQYTRLIAIRTFWEGFERVALIAFTVIDHELQVIIKHVDGIDKGFDNVPAEERILAVAFRELLQKKDHPVAVHELGLGEAEGVTAAPEVFGRGFQFAELGHGGG